MAKKRIRKATTNDAEDMNDLDDMDADDDSGEYSLGGMALDSSEMDEDLPGDEPDVEDLDDDEAEEIEAESRRMDAVALADDPVRMYLKEIGQVPLLNTNREIWLSVQIAAEK
jgi:RNA polymerase primary sigma factor